VLEIAHGHGINDALAMQGATVGVESSEITSEAGDAVILESWLGKVDELIHLGRRCVRLHSRVPSTAWC
jgi:cation transport ATPase